jgi:hypothetical protein
VKPQHLGGPLDAVLVLEEPQQGQLELGLLARRPGGDGRENPGQVAGQPRCVASLENLGKEIDLGLRQETVERP